MKHEELIEALTLLTNAVEGLRSDVKALDEKLVGKIEDIEAALAQWHSDQGHRAEVIDQAIERNRKAIVEDIRPRLKRLETSQRIVGRK